MVVISSAQTEALSGSHAAQKRACSPTSETLDYENAHGKRANQSERCYNAGKLTDSLSESLAYEGGMAKINTDAILGVTLLTGSTCEYLFIR